MSSLALSSKTYKHRMSKLPFEECLDLAPNHHANAITSHGMEFGDKVLGND